MTTKKKTPPRVERGGEFRAPAEPTGDVPRTPTGNASIGQGLARVHAEEFTAAALRYARLGHGVFPCRSAKKGPATPNGFHDSTRDPKQIATWWPERSSAPKNIGSVAPVGYYWLDVDTYKEADPHGPLHRFANELDALGGPCSISGAGGKHFLMMGEPMSDRDLRAKLGVSTGIEVKAQGGYVLLPPSVHPVTGKQYKWQRELSPGLIAPPLPVEYRGTRTRAPASLRMPLGMTIAELREMRSHILEKEFDSYEQWFAWIAALHHETGASDEGLAFAEETSRPGKYTATDKWETLGSYAGAEITMRTFVGLAERAGYRSPQTVARAMAEFTADEFLSNAAAGRFDLRRDRPVREFVFDCLLPAGKVALLAGAGGVSKSYLSMTISAHYVAGRAFGEWFVPVRRGRDDEALLLFAEEDEDDIEIRFRTMVDSVGFDRDELLQVRRRLLMRSLLDFDEGFGLASYEERSRRVVGGALLETLRRVLVGRPTIRLVVLDPMVLLHDLEENDNAGMGRLMRMLNKLAAEARVTVLLTHHFSKAGAQSDELNASSVRGASAITANARAVIVMQRQTAEDAGALHMTAQEAANVVRLSLVKHNHTAPRTDFYVRIGEGGAVELLDGAQPPPMSVASRMEARKQAATDEAVQRRRDGCLRAVLQLVGKHQDIGFNEIVVAKPDGRGRPIVQEVLASAIADGLVSTTMGANSKQCHRLTDLGHAQL